MIGYWHENMYRNFKYGDLVALKSDMCLRGRICEAGIDTISIDLNSKEITVKRSEIIPVSMRAEDYIASI